MKNRPKYRPSPYAVVVVLGIFAASCATPDIENTESNSTPTVHNAVNNFNSAGEGSNFGEVNTNSPDDQFENLAATNENQAKEKLFEENSDLISDEKLELPETKPTPKQNAAVAIAPVSPPIIEQPAATTPVANTAAAPTAAPVPQTAVASIPVTPPVSREVVAQPGKLWWIAYDYVRNDKSLNIQLLTKGRPEFDILQDKSSKNDPELIVRFYNTSVRPKMRRSIDAGEFRAPVKAITVHENRDLSATDVILTLREYVQPTLYSKRGNVQLNFAVAEKYFASVQGWNKPTYVALNLGPSAEKNILPSVKEGSDLPRNGGSGIPNYVGKTFSDASGQQVITQPVNNEPQNIPQNVDGNGLPAADFSKPEEQAAPLPTQGAKRFFMLAVAQETLDLQEAAPAASNAVATPILSESTIAAPNQEITGSDLNQPTGQSYSGKPIALEFFNAPLNTVLKAFSDQVGTNFIYSKEIGERPVTIRLKNVPWDAALDAILETNELAMANVSDNVIRIDNSDKLQNFLQKREQAQQTRVLSEPRKVLMVRLSNAVADAAFKTRLDDFFKIEGINNRTSVNTDPRTNTVFIEAPPRILDRAKALINKLDVPQPQVEVVSRLIEVSRNARDFLGVSWNGGLNFDAGRGLSAGSMNFPNNANSNFSVDPGVVGTSRTGGINFNLGSINDAIDLGLRLKMEESKGTTEILQSNKVIVADRESASISAGQSAFFRVAQSPVFVSGAQQQGSSTGASGNTPGVTRVNFSLELKVTPEVTNDGHVKMALDITSEVPAPVSLAGADISSNRRQLTTRLNKKSGDTAVIGGIYDTRKTENEVGIPIISKIPIIGALFRSKSHSEDQTELMMLITPTIVAKDGGPYLPPSDSPTSAPSMNQGSNNINSNFDTANKTNNANFENNKEVL